MPSRFMDLMSYTRQARLKILGRAEILDGKEHHELAIVLVPQGRETTTERLVRIKIEAFDWNCSQHITRRFTESRVSEAMRPLHQRIEDLEAKLAERGRRT